MSQKRSAELETFYDDHIADKRPQWTKSATDVMQLEFPQKAAAEELLKTWSLRVTSPESSAPHHMLVSDLLETCL